MKRFLMSLVVVAALGFSGAAYAQTTDNDLNNDGVMDNNTGTTGTTMDNQGTAVDTETSTSTTTTTDTYGNQNAYDSDLPGTASPVPLMGLAGLASFGAAYVLRRRSVKR